MRKQLLAGTACATLCVIAFQTSTHAATLDDVMKRLDKLERENADLRAKINHKTVVQRDKSGKPIVESSVVTHAKPAPSPGPVAQRTIFGMPVKAGAFGPLVDNTTVSALFSPGQNYAKDNSDFSYGDYSQCNGASTRGSGSNFPTIALGDRGCNDGSFGNAYSAALKYKNGGFTAIAAYELHENTNRQGDDNTGVANAGAPPIVLPDGSIVSTGIHNEWAAKVGGGYRFNTGPGDLQLNAVYEWIRRDVTPAQQPFNERSKDDVFVSATQYFGKWAISGSYTHAFKTPGNPALLSVNVAGLADTPSVQANLYSDAANQYAIGARYRFNNWASWYVVASELTQGKGGHYCLGPSGHAYALCGRDANNNVIGGATLKAATTGLTFDF